MQIKRLMELLQTFNQEAEILFATGSSQFGDDDVFDIASIYNEMDLKVWVDLLPLLKGNEDETI
jgi:hypothetical protein